MLFNFKSYKELISHAQSEYRFKGDGTYYELHHIIPKSNKGTDDKNNLVLLTLSEHVEAHYLYAIEHREDKKVYYANISAAWLILHGKNGYIKKDKKKAIENWLKDETSQKLTEQLKKELKEMPSPSKGKKFYFEHFWIQKGFATPKSICKKNLQRDLDKGFTLLSDCPICHKENSRENYCCCEEHKNQYLEHLKTMKHEFFSNNMKNQWSKEDSSERKKNIGKANKIALKGKCWMNNGIDCLQVKKEDIELYKSKGYKLGRIFSEQAYLNIKNQKKR